MSSPFAFRPSSTAQAIVGPSPYTSQYYNPPRISPYIPTVALDHSAPNTPNTRARVLDDDDRWYPPQVRARRPSWHAGMATSPANTAPASYWTSGSTPFSTYSPLSDPDSRRRSFDPRLYQPPEIYPSIPGGNPWQISPGYQPQVRSDMHPLLSGGSRYIPILFDLSQPNFNPLQVVGSGQTRAVSPQELGQPATYPPTTRLTIICDVVPQWPIYLDYDAAMSAASNGYFPGPATSTTTPITVGDVLFSIHTSLQTQISHLDWAQLTSSEERAISRAYSRRCRLIPTQEQVLASQGVRRVDYLMKSCMFAGLVRNAGDEGFDNIKLQVTTR